MMRWANDRVRVQYLGAIGGRRMIGKSWSSQYIIAKNFDAHVALFSQKLKDTETMYLKRSSIYKHELRVDFSNVLDGQQAMFIVFNTALSKNETAYNSWYVTNSQIYDDFWFDYNNTAILFRSARFILGQEGI